MMMKKNMEKRFQWVLGVLIIVMVLSLSACKSKEPVTVDVFQEKLESQEYEIVDMAEQYAVYEHILGALGTEKGSVHIEFFEVDNKDNAAAMFNGNKESVEAYKSGNIKEASSSTGNHQKYSLTTSDTFYTIVQVENTLIYARSSKDDKGTLEGIITDLGY